MFPQIILRWRIPFWFLEENEPSGVSLCHGPGRELEAAPCRRARRPRLASYAPVLQKEGRPPGVPAWRIPQTEVPGGPQSVGSRSWTRLSD